MSIVPLHVTHPVNLSDDINVSIAKDKGSASKRTEGRAARNAERVEQHKKDIENIWKAVKVSAGRV